jgi:hypothetical protein
MSLRQFFFYPPSANDLFPMGVWSFREECQWIRLSLVDLVLLGGGRWRWILDPNKARNKSEEGGYFWRGTGTHMMNGLISLSLMILFTFYGSDSLRKAYSGPRGLQTVFELRKLQP